MKPWLQEKKAPVFVGFQPTYEELKRVTAALLELDTESFQPTYEELKPEGLNDVTTVIQCFQPTYEELKPPARAPHRLRG